MKTKLLLVSLFLLLPWAARAAGHALELTLGPDLVLAANNTVSSERTSATAGLALKAGEQMAIGIEMQADPPTAEAGVISFGPVVRLQAEPNTFANGMVPFLQLGIGSVTLPVAKSSTAQHNWEMTLTPKLGAQFPVAENWSTYVEGGISLEADGGIRNTDAGGSFGILVKMGHR